MSDSQFGPQTELARELHATKYRTANESFKDYANRVAAATMGPEDFHAARDMLLQQRFLPGGRIQAATGAARQTTAFNCFVSGEIEDSMTSIMHIATQAAETMRRGGGIGYDFSTIRPAGDLIRTLDSHASGPVSFMGIFNAVCGTIAAAGQRRGAQMGVLRVDHPDILEFIRAKRNSDQLNAFNISVGITNDFMEALTSKTPFELKFEGRTYGTVDPAMLWDEIMRSTWDWAEPGVLFIDKINALNPLMGQETIAATNPCGEQPLPPHGACLLGSFNMPAYLRTEVTRHGKVIVQGMNWTLLAHDVDLAVRMLNAVIDQSIYPLPEQEAEAKAKRRMGLGVTGVANWAELLGAPYGSPQHLALQSNLLEAIATEARTESAMLARRDGSVIELGSKEHCAYMDSIYIQRMLPHVRNLLWKFGTRNTHMLSIAPCGTISLCADNVSSGIEPPYTLEYERVIQTVDGPEISKVQDWAYRYFGHEGRTAEEVSPEEHVDVLANAQYWVDSAVSKTINVGPDVSFKDFKDIYTYAFRRGCKGVTTFRAAGKRAGILRAKEPDSGSSCSIDPETGVSTCGE